MSVPQVYLNGQWLPQDQAKISVFDRGFLFADSVYDVIALYHGKPFYEAAHFKRLCRSCQEIKMPCPLTAEQFNHLLHALDAQTNAAHTAVYIQITRGVGQGRAHQIPPGLTPTVFAMGNAFTPPALTALSTGISAITLLDNRWARCDIKATSLLANILALDAAQQAQAEEALYMKSGFLTEAPSAAAFIVKDGSLLCPPLDAHLLPSITRQVIAELAELHSIPYREQPISHDDLRAADEIIIASTLREIRAVVTLDGHPVGDGRPGPIWSTLIEAFKIHSGQL